MARSLQLQRRQQRSVDLPLLVDGDTADLLAEPVHIDGAELFDKHARAFTADVELRSERGSAAGNLRTRDEQGALHRCTTLIATHGGQDRVDVRTLLGQAMLGA